MVVIHLFKYIVLCLRGPDSPVFDPRGSTSSLRRIIVFYCPRCRKMRWNRRGVTAEDEEAVAGVSPEPSRQAFAARLRANPSRVLLRVEEDLWKLCLPVMLCLSDTVFGETAAALSFKEIRRRDPSFSLPDFVAEVQDMVRPVLIAYLKDTIQTVYYAWAMQLMDAEELGEGALYPTWRLRELQQLNVQALI
ncbi:hypothetical protein Taro_035007 [Colocasia esculenta]|uniref:Uncharacterized protein n=1 Tax=Colocasia esculenta TaxID=4460 RepID=A0A843VZ99_COLES|nr:hypothetical protein [Colocasia esculenta]